MSLFVMNRYWGEEENDDAKDASSETRTKIITKSSVKYTKKRKSQLQSKESISVNACDDDNTNSKVNKSRKHRLSAKEDDISDDSVGLDDCSEDMTKSKSKKSRKHRLNAKSDDNDMNEVLNHDSKVVKQKRKCKNSNEETSESQTSDYTKAIKKIKRTNDNIDNDEIIVDRKVMKNKNNVNELLDQQDREVKQQISPKKRKRKSKKRINDSESVTSKTDDISLVKFSITAKKLKVIDTQELDESIDDESDESAKDGGQKSHKNKKGIDENVDEIDKDAKDRRKKTRKKDNDGSKGLGENVGEIDKDAKDGAKGLTEDRGGFTVLGQVKETSKPKVRRTLPDWIRSPYIVSPDLLLDQQPLTTIPHISPHILDSLRENGIHHFFPVQLQVIPAILTDSLHGVYHGRAGSRPGDVCCSAPTGSGKTLSFVIPMIQLLEKRVVPQVRCVVLLPVIDLATQVYKVFTTYAKPTNLKVALLSGQKSFETEQAEIVKHTDHGYRSLVDIIVTTPGRLVDHVTSTPGLDLRHLRYLIIDEADRMMTELKQDWLVRLQEAVYSTNHHTASSHYPQFIRTAPGHMTAANNLKMEVPLQKLIFSATLSLNPEILQQLDLFQPRLYTSLRDSQGHKMPNLTKVAKDKKGVDNNLRDTDTEMIGTLVKPAGLKEYYTVVRGDQKPLAIAHLLTNLKYTQILCFTNSIDSAYRLSLVLKHLGHIKVNEMSSNKLPKARQSTLDRFTKGLIDILVCTDTMARGMDIENVQYVVSYDIPHHQLTYMHRVGRTARAGRPGTAITLVQPKEIGYYKKLMKENGDKAVEFNLDKEVMGKLGPAVEVALGKTAPIIERKARKANAISKRRNPRQAAKSAVPSKKSKRTKRPQSSTRHRAKRNSKKMTK